MGPGHIYAPSTAYTTFLQSYEKHIPFPVFGCVPPSRALVFLRFYFSMLSFFPDRHDLTDSWFAPRCHPSLACSVIRLATLRSPAAGSESPPELHQLDSGTLPELKSAFQAVVWDGHVDLQSYTIVSTLGVANLSKQSRNDLQLKSYEDILCGPITTVDVILSWYCICILTDILCENRGKNGPVPHNCVAPRMRRVNMNRIINDFFEKEERGQPASKLHINK